MEDVVLYCEILPDLVAQSVRSALRQVRYEDLDHAKSIDDELAEAVSELLDKHVNAIRAIIESRQFDLASSIDLHRSYQDALNTLDQELNTDRATGDLYVFERYVLVKLFTGEIAEKFRGKKQP